MQPYYTIMKLPGETGTEFIQMLPYTPRQKDNLAAWMVARSDAPNYGKLVVFQFPKQKVVFGPRQIVARIHQDQVIAPQITLWNQQGSEVIQGTLLTIPIEESLLYIRPLYLRSAGGRIPEDEDLEALEMEMMAGAAAQAEAEEEAAERARAERGPVAIEYDDDGKPTPALLKKLAASGLEGTDPASLRSVGRSTSRTEAGTFPSSVTTASASPPGVMRAWWYSAMFTPAPPSAVPTCPMTPGTSSLPSTRGRKSTSFGVARERSHEPDVCTPNIAIENFMPDKAICPISGESCGASRFSSGIPVMSCSGTRTWPGSHGGLIGKHCSRISGFEPERFCGDSARAAI